MQTRVLRGCRLAVVALLMACGGGSTAAIPIASISLSPSTVNTLAPNATVQLTASVKDAAGNVLTGRTVAWSSSNSAVAQVTASGTITAVAEGTTTITATAETIRASVSVTVRIPVGSVVLSPGSATIIVGATQSFVATPRDASGAPLGGRVVSWSSTSPTVLTVNDAGQSTAVSPGSAFVTATVDGVSGSAAVTVLPVPVFSVTVAPATFSLAQGAAQALTATVRDASGNTLTGRTVNWSSANAAIATVSTAGVVTAISGGSTTISANVDGVNGSSVITVTLVPIATISPTPATASIVEGKTQALLAVSRDANGNTLTGRAIVWTTSNATIATVSTTGIVTALSAGSVIISAAAEGKTGSAAITVRPLLLEAAVVVTSSSTTDSAQRVVTLTGPTSTFQTSLAVRNSTGGALLANTVTWTSRDPSRATVSSTGLITGVRAGRTFVVAQSLNNSVIADSVVVFVPQNATGPLLRTTMPSYRVIATDTFSIVVQVEMRDGRSLAAADFEVAWPGSAADPFNPFTVTGVTALRPGVVYSFAADATEVARVTWASTTPVSGTIALVRLSCRVARRGVVNQMLFTLNSLFASDLADLTSTASAFNPLIIIP